MKVSIGDSIRRTCNACHRERAAARYVITKRVSFPAYNPITTFGKGGPVQRRLYVAGAIVHLTGFAGARNKHCR